MREKGFHGLIVLLEAGIDQFSTEFVYFRQQLPVARRVNVQFVGQIRGHFQHFPLGILVVGLPHQRLHFHQVDHSLEVVFRSDRKLHG